MKGLGAALVILGFLGLLFGGIPYRKTETVAQIGDFKMRATADRQLPLPPVVCGFAILVGAAIWFGAGRKPSA
ncbi:MAG: hypothetical protein AAB290_06505 [Candidatus Eisenbacteria bacterium]